MMHEDLQKPQVGISSVWFEGNSCNMHLLSLAQKVKEGVSAAGLVGMRFNTIGVSDGISMGTDGMSERPAEWSVNWCTRLASVDASLRSA